MYLSLQINKIVCHPERSEGPLFDVIRAARILPEGNRAAHASRITAARPKTKTRRRASLPGASHLLRSREKSAAALLNSSYCAASTFFKLGFGICQRIPESSALCG